MTVWSDRPIRQDIHTDINGADLAVPFTLSINGVAYVWAGTTITTAITNDRGVAAAVPTLTFTTGAAGAATISLTAAQKATLGVGFYNYSITAAVGAVLKWSLAGTFSIALGITPGSATAGIGITVTNGTVAVDATSFISVTAAASDPAFTSRYVPGEIVDAAFGNGVLDATAHLQAKITAAVTGKGVVWVPPGTYLTTSALTVPAGVRIIGVSKSLSIIKRGHAGNLISSMGSFSGLESIRLEGNAAGFPTTGKGVVVVAGTGFGYALAFRDVDIEGFPESCLEFAANAGSAFTWVGGIAFTTATVGVGAAITINGTDSAAVPRHFTNIESGGCTLFDFGGGNDIFVIGGFSAGLLFGTASHGVQIKNMRVAPPSGSVTIKGTEHIIQALFGRPVILDASCHGVTLTGSIVPSFDITDNGTGNFFTVNKGWTPTWGATSAPVLNNGRMRSIVQRDGSRVFLSIDLKGGSSTTFGTGEWYFNLPYAPTLAQRNLGQVHLIDSSSGDHFDGIAFTNDGGVVFLIWVVTDTAKGYVTNTFPFTWAVNDEMIIDFGYVAA